MQQDKEFWDRHYREFRDYLPSSFAVFCKENYIKEGSLILEAGCGNGRDSFYFHGENKNNIIALDSSLSAVTSVLDQINPFESDGSFTVEQRDFTRLSQDYSPDCIYSRFTLHSIDEDGEDRFLKWAGNVLPDEGLLMVEVRSIKDSLYRVGEDLGNDAFFSDHYRRFANLDKLIDKIEKSGLTIIYSIEDSGLAIYEPTGEDPVVIRIVAKK